MSTDSSNNSSNASPNTPSSKSALDKQDEWSGATAVKFDTKAYSEYYDPCQEAADRSIRCLKRNGGDRKMCHDFFQAYRDCKEQWQAARKEARKKTPWW